MITIQELLNNRGLDLNSKIKLVRHKDSRRDVYNLYRTNRDEFLAYQNTQSKDIFNDVQFIVSFVGEEGLLARFGRKFGNGRRRSMKALVENPYYRKDCNSLNHTLNGYFGKNKDKEYLEMEVVFEDGMYYPYFNRKIMAPIFLE